MSKLYISFKFYFRAEYAEKTISLDKNFFENDRMKYSENSKTCIITISGNIHSLGKVLNCNTESLNILEYSHTEIIGHSINQIIPNVLAEIHDELMRRYFDTSVSKAMGKERIVFALNKSGYIVPCTLMIKVFPNLNEGIRVVGFLKKVELTTPSTTHTKGGEETTTTTSSSSNSKVRK